MARYNDVLVLSLLVLQFAAVLAQVDRTLEDGATGRDVVIATVNRIQESGIFPDSFKFLRRMALVESNDGEEETTGGIWNLARSDVWTKLQKFFQGVERNPRARSVQMQVQSAFDIPWDSTCPTVQDLNKPLYSALAVMLYIQAKQKTIPDSISGQAALWQDLFNTGQTTLTPDNFISVAVALEDEECEIKGVDMVFVMDVSGSVTAPNYELMKQLAIDITDEFEIGPDRTRVGWINFNSDAWVVFDLTTHTDKSSLHQAMRNIEYAGGFTDIGAALLKLHTEGFTSARSDLDVPHVAIVVTDGRSNEGSIKDAARRIHEERRVDTYAVGIRGFVYEQLLEIAKAGIAKDPARNVFTLPDFGVEGLNQLQEALKARTCLNARFVEATLEDLQDFESSIPEGVTSYINIGCPSQGVTINVCGKGGKVILFISTTTPTPNSAMHDERIEVEENKCLDTFVKCVAEENDRRRRQAAPSDRIFLGIEGVEENNRYELNGNAGDSSTPRVKLQCQRSIILEPQSVTVTCNSERELTKIICSINNGPFQNCTLPWVIDVVSIGARDYYLQINVTDSLNLTDSAVIEYTVKPLVLGCWLSDGMSVDCQSSNQLDLQRTECRSLGGQPEPCTLPYQVQLKGLLAGVYEVQIEATDVFGFTDQSTVQYQVVEDRVSDDMVMSVPLDISPSEVGLAGNTLSLCYQIHGRAGKYFNLLSDQCISVNAHIVQPHSGIDSNVMDQIGVRAVGSNGSCYNIQIDRHDCSTHINGQQLLVNVFEEEDIVVRQYAASIGRPQSAQISVPNCDGESIDMFISCTYYDIQNVATEILQFGSTRGEALAEPPHGLIGQFWGVFLSAQPYTGDRGRLSPGNDPYVVSIIHPDDSKEREFVATLVSHIWGSRQTPCLYAGDKQGGRTGSVDGGPRGTVIQGKYMDYEVEELFHTQFTYSKFEETKC